MKEYHVPVRKKLGEILLNKGQISPEELIKMLQLQKLSGKALGQVLVEHKIVTQEELNQILGDQLGIPHVWLRKGMVDPRIVHLLPKDKALQYRVIPMFCVNGRLTLATADPSTPFIFKEVARITNMQIQPVVCRTDDILAMINECYREEMDMAEVMTKLDTAGIEIMQASQEKAISEIAEMAEGSPVINLTNMIMLKAIRERASDIHIEPQIGAFRVRARVDGLLYELMSPPIEMHPAVVSRLKVMANLDIAERRLPQDGRIQVMVDGGIVDLRFSSMPTIHGEKIVLRILDQRQSILDLNQLGFHPDVLSTFKTLLKRPYGLILVCGPTGSGKTTTLYSAITMLNVLEKNIITIEDPVEYQLKGINQNQVKESIGLNFARFLKHALRQDPDIIMVGEIRDRETAEIAIQASLTGHLVLSTLHTNDSASAITRLLEMGIEPYLISSALLAPLAQRLVRTVCPACKTTYYAPRNVLKDLGLDETRTVSLVKGRGCSVCLDSGFKGRTAIHEILSMDDSLRALILTNPTIDVLQRHLRAQGHRTLRDAGMEKVLEGLTTIEEITRATTLETE
ncbi:MAG: Flp pilus assembly complex ATPase component TadA [Syntrophales bacterium]|jgi:type IV pilus assembly protein PilB|nr:Flp pilus assembly complex ATPase component TadA [Syntrophales bacterium]